MIVASKEPVRVLLVHGMGRSPLSLYRLGRDLQRSGYEPRSAGYLASTESFQGIVHRIRGHLTKLGAEGKPYAVIGHSLGGLLVRAALSDMSGGSLPAHLIMMGTPHRPPKLALRYGPLWPYRLVNGECGQVLARTSFFDQLPPLSVPYTIIAGNRGWVGRGSPFTGEPNDGIVALSETLVCSHDAPIVLPVRHTFMMNDHRVRDEIRRVLKRVAA